MTTKLDSSVYAAMNENMSTMLKTGLYGSICITIYSDEAGTTVASDSAGAIDKRPLKQINITAPYVVKATGQQVNASITLVFGDSSSLKAVDAVDNFWYKLEGIPIQRRQF
jgi:hypothetical protein